MFMCFGSHVLRGASKSIAQTRARIMEGEFLYPVGDEEWLAQLFGAPPQICLPNDTAPPYDLTAPSDHDAIRPVGFVSNRSLHNIICRRSRSPPQRNTQITLDSSRRAVYFEHCIQQARCGRNDLAERCEQLIRRCLASLGSVSFKIGITSSPSHRFNHRDYGYFSFFAVVVLHGSATVSGAQALERALIASMWGNRQCMNVAPGGEGVSPGSGETFVYVAFRRGEHRATIRPLRGFDPLL